MIKNLKAACGLPLAFDSRTSELALGPELNLPSYSVRKLHDLDPVWANPVSDPDRVIYRYTAGLYLKDDGPLWAAANVIYGIVIFSPGIYGGEYVKSSGQYHPPMPPSNMATPEIYTVLSGIGHFLLQKASPPYEEIRDPVVIEVRAGESFIVPPNYGHLQINASPEPLVFSYVVRDGLKGQYDPYRARRGAMYYMMAESSPRFKFNSHYGARQPLRQLRANQLQQIPGLSGAVTYQFVRDRLPELGFLVDPTLFPTYAGL